MEAGEHGLTRETCCVARGLELVAVDGLMWVSRCVFGGARFFVCVRVLLYVYILAKRQKAVYRLVTEPQGGPQKYTLTFAYDSPR